MICSPFCHILVVPSTLTQKVGVDYVFPDRSIKLKTNFSKYKLKIFFYLLIKRKKINEFFFVAFECKRRLFTKQKAVQRLDN